MVGAIGPEVDRNWGDFLMELQSKRAQMRKSRLLATPWGNPE